MTFNHFVRRLHLCLGLGLLPWFLMYGIGAFPFGHRAFFESKYQDGKPEWTVLFDRQYSVRLAEGDNLRQVAGRILQDAGQKGAYGIYRPDNQRLFIYLFSFWSATQFTYFPEQQRLLAEVRRFRWDHTLTGMHGRGGFGQDSFLDDAWAVFVDIVCAGLLLWIVTGLYMWWQIRHTRFWGILALSAGVGSFLTFLAVL